ncbi:MAG: thiaminase II [Candidatus Tectomicrobia bacterium]|uniref:Aminopyrimidine aminohydrolase n=1 Tax=Tectimicrobiota bacterium TaxID=2528274 RepID=A0A932HZ08_UNCTE|nr:thiaminase II [Candidatus Tectomicrobia bacterium]
MAEPFSETLRREAEPLWKAIHAHPFVRGIGDGTLPIERFRFYMCQDYFFLIEYSRVIALAAAKAPRLDEMGRFADLLNATLSTEMDLHRGFAAKFGIPNEELEATRPAPACRAYTNYLLEAAYSGTFGEAAAAMLPCQWDYALIGQELAARGAPKGAPLYAEWIGMYASEEFGRLAAWLREILDRAAAEAGPAERERMRAHFLAGTRYEYLFWDMSWRMEEWPV